MTCRLKKPCSRLESVDQNWAQTGAEGEPPSAVGHELFTYFLTFPNCDSASLSLVLSTPANQL